MNWTSRNVTANARSKSAKHKSAVRRTLTTTQTKIAPTRGVRCDYDGHDGGGNSGGGGGSDGIMMVINIMMMTMSAIDWG